MNVLLSNCKQSITSLSLLVGTAVVYYAYILTQTLVCILTADYTVKP